MNDPVPDGSVTFLETARQALDSALAGAPEDGSQEYALVTFGADCNAEASLPFSGNPRGLLERLNLLRADAATPLAKGLRRAQHLALDEASSDKVQLVLLSDGIETCDGDPIAVAEAIGAGRRAKLGGQVLAQTIGLHAIGLGLVPGGEAERQVQSIARAANGNYFRVIEPTELAAILGLASGLEPLSIPTLSGRVTNHLGEPVQGARLQLRDMRENTDADGNYLFANDSRVQGAENLMVNLDGYEPFTTEVYLLGDDMAFDVRLELGPEAFPKAVAQTESPWVETGEQITLQGRESQDPNGGRLLFHWSQSSGNPLPVTFSANDSEVAVAVQVTLDDPGTYQFVLVVENELGLESASDTVAVTAQNPIITSSFPIPGGTEMVFVRLPPGTFTMGSPLSESGRTPDEGPQHEVTISRGFWMGKFEVTQAQWEAVMGTAPWSGQTYVQSHPDHPAVYISWNSAQSFIAQLNQAEGSQVYRLPTEAEWEYAARAGTQTPWSFGEDESQLWDYAWYTANTWDAGEEYAHAVGTKLANPWGLHDMHGNVWEWVSDWFAEDYYSRSPSVDPQGPEFGTNHVMRSGRFSYFAQRVRSAHRFRHAANHTRWGLGVRILRAE
ncbi:MAG: SUMF1/EgtB/PvdO family nonheme iron enzyme [Candidatus Latescibacteria bacterium]|nr:SUMF1/EgtB/PvdO family nonheme iron enzyme [Candidatus Latescibacterota bacterium]